MNERWRDCKRGRWPTEREMKMDKLWPDGRDRARHRKSGSKSAGWLGPALRLWETRREGDHVDRGTGNVDFHGRIRGIATKLRFIWIGLLIETCHPILKHTPEPSITVSFPLPCVSSKHRFFHSLPLHCHGRVPRIRPLCKAAA